MRISPFASAYDHILLDLDGCVWVGDEATPGAVEAIAALRQARKRLAFITNNSRQAGEDFVRKLWGLGIQASLEEVVTAGGAVQHVLAERFDGGSAVVIGAPALQRHVADAGLRIVNGTDFVARAAVVVVGLDYDFRYADLRDAVLAIHGGATLIATNRDATMPMPEGPWPGSGATAEIVGKPEPQLFLTALDRLGPGRTVMIGDRVESDLVGAAAAGIDAAIVLTGASSESEALAADPAPVAIGATLAELVLARD